MTRFSAEEVSNALRANKGLVQPTAKTLRCSDATVYRYIKKYPTVAKAREEGRRSFVDVAETALYTAVVERKPWAVSLVLKTIGRERGYVERQEIEHSGDIEIKLTFDETND